MIEEIEKIVRNEILDVYKGIRNFLLDDEKYFKQLIDIENEKATKEKAVGIATSIAKCFLNFFSCDIAGTLLEGTRDVVGSLKGDKNEIQGLSAAYDHIVKKHNSYYKNLKVKKDKGFGKVNVYGYNKQKDCYYKKEKPEIEIARLKTTSEMLEEIYNKYGIEGKTIKGRKERKKISETVAIHFKSLNDINNEKNINELQDRNEDLERKTREQAKTLKEQEKRLSMLEKRNEEQEKRLSMLEKRNEQQEVDPEKLRKDVEILHNGKEGQVEQQKMLEARINEKPQIQQVAQITNSVATQTPQKEDKGIQVQSLSDRFKGLERLKLPKTNDVKEEQIQTPLASQPLDDKVSKTSVKQLSELDDENSRVKSARKEIEERTHQNGLASRSMPC